MPKMTGEEILALIRDVMPQNTLPTRIEALRDDFLRLRVQPEECHVRPGGTLSGPLLMTIADMGMYYLVLAMIGPEPLALTSNLSIHFLRAPKIGELIAETTMLKRGRRLAIGEVKIFGSGSPEPVAHATVTYSIPPRAAEATKPSR